MNARRLLRSVEKNIRRRNLQQRDDKVARDTPKEPIISFSPSIVEVLEHPFPLMICWRIRRRTRSAHLMYLEWRHRNWPTQEGNRESVSRSLFAEFCDIVEKLRPHTDVN